jgi:hypothetical protein
MIEILFAMIRAVLQVLKSTYLLIMFGIRKNCNSSGRIVLLYLLIKRVLKLTSNYRGISLLPASYKILSNILVSRLIPYVDKITEDHQCGL